MGFKYQYALTFAKCVKQLGFYTCLDVKGTNDTFAKCVKQLGFYTWNLFGVVYSEVC